MDKAVLTRVLMTLGAVIVIAVARKYFPSAGDDLTDAAKDLLLLAGGGLLGAGHVTKPGDLKAVP